MAIGDSIQAGLLKADFSPIERSGQSIGQGYKSLGQNLFMGSGGGTGGGTRSSRSVGSSPSGIGGAIERFSENKKKGEQAEMELLGLIETMSPSRLEDLDSGKSRFSKAYKRFIDGELTPNQTEALFGGLVLSEKRNNEVEEKQKLVDFSNFIMSGTEMDPEVVEDFNQAQPGLSALSGDPGARNQFLEYQRDNAPKTGPLGGELGSSDFARFAKEQGIDPVLAGSRFMNLQKAEDEAELANQPKAPDPFKLSDEFRKATEFEQGQDAITFTPERNTIVLGDTAYGISGKFGNEAEVIKLKSVEIPNYSNMNSVMNQLISLGETRKTTKFMSNADKTLAQSLSNQLRGLLREQILGPGTVNDSERAILNEIVQNPTTWMDTAGNTQSKIDSLKGIRKDAFNKLKTRLTGLGLDVAEVEQGGASTPSKSSVDFNQETSSGLGYTEINLDQL